VPFTKTILTLGDVLDPQTPQSRHTLLINREFSLAFVVSAVVIQLRSLISGISNLETRGNKAFGSYRKTITGRRAKLVCEHIQPCPGVEQRKPQILSELIGLDELRDELLFGGWALTSRPAPSALPNWLDMYLIQLRTPIMDEAHDLAQPRTAFLRQRDSDTERKPSLLKELDRLHDAGK
jgi:hypothetical protein